MPSRQLSRFEEMTSPLDSVVVSSSTAASFYRFDIYRCSNWEKRPAGRSVACRFHDQQLQPENGFSPYFTRETENQPPRQQYIWSSFAFGARYAANSTQPIVVCICFAIALVWLTGGECDTIPDCWRLPDKE